MFFAYFSFFFFLDSNQHHATAGPIWVGWSGLANSSARYLALTSESPIVLGKKTHSVHRSEVILAHTMSTHSDAPSVRKVSVEGKQVRTIIPASMVGGARRQSRGRAAGCTAPCRAACPGCHSCSR